MNKEDYLAVMGASPIKDVFVEEWQKTVYIKRMMGAASDEFERLARKDHHKAKLHLLQNTLCTSDGTLIFEPKDHDTINKLDGAVLVKLLKVAYDHQAVKKEEVDELEKNSDAEK